MERKWKYFINLFLGLFSSRTVSATFRHLKLLKSIVARTQDACRISPPQMNHSSTTIHFKWVRTNSEQSSPNPRTYWTGFFFLARIRWRPRISRIHLLLNNKRIGIAFKATYRRPQHFHKRVRSWRHRIAMQHSWSIVRDRRLYQWVPGNWKQKI